MSDRYRPEADRAPDIAIADIPEMSGYASRSFSQLHMDIEPKTLGEPLHKKDMSSFWFALACVGLGAVAIRPSRASEWIVALAIVGPTFWVSFGGPSFIHHWQNNAVPVVRGIVFVGRIAFAAVVLWYIAPPLVAAFDTLFHA